MHWPRTLHLFASLAGASAILLAAAAAHIPGLADASRSLVERAAFYQLIHAGILLLLSMHWRTCFRLTAMAFILGMVFFCGGIYLHHLAGNPLLQRVIPAGGISFTLGWLLLLLGLRPPAILPPPQQ